MLCMRFFYCLRTHHQHNEECYEHNFMHNSYIEHNPARGCLYSYIDVQAAYDL